MIIGVQIGDTSGCAVYDKGKILYAASEERFTKRKKKIKKLFLLIIKIKKEKMKIV